MSKGNGKLLVFACGPDGKIVHVDEVPNGMGCECWCPHCRTPLIAKNHGRKRTHHFAHSGRSETSSCSETALHAAAKQLVADSMLIKLPAPTLFDAMPDISTLSVFSEVCVEHRVETIDAAHHIVADCFAQAPDYTLIVEIAVFHRVPQEKAAYLCDLKLAAVEIDLQDCVGKHTTWETLAQLVLCDPLRRSWIVEAATLPAPQQMDEMTPEPTVQLDTPSLRGEWTYFIGNKTVWVRELPYRNIKVFHRPSLETRRIVEPLCRGRGYWDNRFNCWIVFDQFKNSLLHDLEEAQCL